MPRVEFPKLFKTLRLVIRRLLRLSTVFMLPPPLGGYGGILSLIISLIFFAGYLSGGYRIFIRGVAGYLSGWYRIFIRVFRWVGTHDCIDSAGLSLAVCIYDMDKSGVGEILEQLRHRIRQDAYAIREIFIACVTVASGTL